MNDRQVDILTLLGALNAGKRLILGGTFVLCLMAAGVSLLLPNEYEAQVQLLPPKEQKQGFGFADLLSSLPIPSLRLGEKGTPADIFIATLKSETMRRQMVEDFKLMQVYEAETMTEALETLKQQTIIGKSEEGTILISVFDQSPQRAADMANHYLALLDNTNRRLSHEAAQDRYNFISALLDRESVKLDGFMGVLKEFQSEHNAISLEDQARAVIRAASEMQLTTMELEISRKSLLASGFSADHPEVQKLDQERLLRQQALALLRDGSNRESSTGSLSLHLDENLFLPLRDIPQVAQDYAKIEKDVLVQTALMKMLLEQKAESLIEASNTTSTVQALDPATVPEKKAKPQRFLIVFVTAILGLFATSCYVLGAGYVRLLRERWDAGRPL
jgi:LPS O-antigen subunit length determinant protein (WzzB/FepE family)